MDASTLSFHSDLTNKLKMKLLHLLLSKNFTAAFTLKQMICDFTGYRIGMISVIAAISLPNAGKL